MSHLSHQTDSQPSKAQQTTLPPELDAKLRKLANLLIDRMLEEHRKICRGQSNQNGLK